MSSDLSYCVRCGGCKAQCPTYAEDAHEGMGARGRAVLLGKLAGGELGPSSELDEKISSCMLCGACNSLCPLGISITDAVYEYRRKLRDSSRRRRVFNAGVKLAFKNPSAGFRALKFIESIGEVLPVHRFPPLKTLRKAGIRSLDPALRDGMTIFKVAKPKARVALFAGCTVNFLFPHMGRSLIRSLNLMSYEVILPKGEACCGAPLLALGLEEDAVELAERNMKVFKKMKVEAVIGLCPTCIHFIRNEYRRLIGDGIENALEVSQFFNLQPLAFNLQPSTSKVVYHDPCHSRYGLGVRSEPRRILRSMGMDLMDVESGCCGFGGTFRLLYRDLSEGILRRRIGEYRKADMIVTSCPNCILQFRGAIQDRSVRHIAEVIGEAIQGDRDGKKR